MVNRFTDRCRYAIGQAADGFWTEENESWTPFT